MRHVYLDNSATTALDPLVLEATTPYLTECFGNASSIHTYGQKARAAVEKARRQVADLIGADSNEIIFTSGGTESDNFALRGAVSALRSRGDHVVASAVEHSAVLRTCERLQTEGFRVTFVPVDGEGRVRLDLLETAIEEDTVVVSVMHSNNEIGTIQDLPAISRLLRSRGILFHTDAVQSVGKVPVRVDELGVDLLSLSGHKLHGPKGVGALFVRKSVSIDPILFGGTHERGLRPGTENVPGIVGLGKACELAQEHLSDVDVGVRRLRDHLERGVLEEVPDCVVNGSGADRVPHLSSISFRGIEGEALLISLDCEGVAVSTGSACSSGTVRISHVLAALGRQPELAQGALRFSLSRFTTEEEIDYALQILPPAVVRMREAAPLVR